MGETLIGEVAEATGLPQEAITKELDALVRAAGIEREALTLDDLREVLAAYVQDVLLSAKDEF